MKQISFLATASFLASLLPVSTGLADVPATTVFEAGRDGYKVFRIPAIVDAANGDLLAFCEARQGGDASEIDLVLKRSSDGGKTWGPIEIAQESDDFLSLFGEDTPEITIGNPAPVVDHLDPNHPGRLWLPFTLENDRVFVTYSDDSGKNWAPRREITEDVKKEPWGWYATGPVHSIQLQRAPHCGRLVIPCDHRLSDDGEDRGPSGVHAVISDDHGKTWRIGALDETYEDGLNANETTVVELNDGSLYFNTRNQNGEAPGTRGEAWSRDGGESFESGSADWKEFRPVETEVLDPPVVQCALLRASTDLIVFSGPDENGPTGKGRSDLRIRYSKDEAKTWHDGPLIHTGPAAYSDMVQVDEDTVGILFEAGEEGTYESIRFATLKVDEIRSEHLAIYERGGGYGYRIPALVTAKNGDLLAFCERRFGLSDHAKNDIVLRRSEDNGKTWTPLEIIHDAGGDSLNDPSAIVLENGDIVLMYQRFPEGYHTISRHHMTMAERGYGGPRNTQTLMRRSSDHGKTWGEAIDVTKVVRRPEAVNIASPGRGIQLTLGKHKGRLLFPVYENHSTTEERIWNTSVLISDDNGKTWRTGDMVPPDELGGYGNENQIVELKDGSVLMSSRNQVGEKLRRLTVSQDGGETWAPYRLAADLVTPQCMASVIRKGDLLVHSLPNSSGRRDGAILVSRDEGDTWKRVHTVTPGGFAYSSLTLLTDGTVACLYEADRYDSIRLAVVPDSAFLAGNLPFLEANETVGGISVASILESLGAKMETGVSADQREGYNRQFGFTDRDGDGRHSKTEYIENGNYLNPQARRGIFSASDSDGDGFVTKAEYILNRIITDEAKSIVQAMDDDGNGVVNKEEFVRNSTKKLKDEKLAAAVFSSLDTNKDDEIVVPEYLRVWGKWARAGQATPEKRLEKTRTE